MSDTICVGAISGAFGVRGDVRLKSFCADPGAIADYGTLASEDGTRRFDITLTGPIKNGFSARIDGVETKEQADALSGVRLYVARDSLPALPDDEFYHTDLIGLAVFDTGGVEVGRVTAVNNHGAGDFLEIEGPGIRNTALLPFTRDAVPTVDLSAGRIIIDPPDGVLPE
ncbi:ribosome maturation factor RimM [Aliiroseovarius sp.]|uniref:ribosome maturation factor RimM n=1 Tax=Aliiroseovarius sp. TaxID=1872442 RepID=UPI00261013CB|nr:ribosome maturation factor RimM [Aliiroseovarius sp.]